MTIGGGASVRRSFSRKSRKPVVDRASYILHTNNKLLILNLWVDVTGRRVVIPIKSLGRATVSAPGKCKVQRTSKNLVKMKLKVLKMLLFFVAVLIGVSGKSHFTVSYQFFFNIHRNVILNEPYCHMNCMYYLQH